MMKYTEQGYVTPLSSSVDETISSIEQDNKISLTPLWEYVIRSQSLPESLDLDLFFETIRDRLHDPEWEVRQHALRVLVDFIPLIPSELLDEKIEIVIGDLVANLGHLGPAVRKGAVDSLRAYINHTNKTDDVLRGLVENGIEKCQENKVQTNVVLGIILSLPFLISNKLNDETTTYIIHRLLDKIVKVIHQETVLRSLLRIREIIGYDRFNSALVTHDTYNSKKEFDLLCEVYDLHTFKTTKSNPEPERFIQTTIPGPDFKKILKPETTLVKTEDVIEEIIVNPNEDPVILETEIQLESGPAITMKIHEEKEQDNKADNEDRNNPTFKILPDDSEPDEYEHLRRTPRRVRFGGEIVKLRTPDSDSNPDDATISIIANEQGDKPVIEIKYIENETKTTTRTSKSLIPIPAKQSQSEPNSPSHSNLYKSRGYKSSPNLSRTKSGATRSRIPKRFNTEIKQSVETKIQINICEGKVSKDETKIAKLDKPKDNTKPKRSPKATVYSPVRRNSREDEFSPVPVHNEIEVLHNLTRSPSPTYRKRNDSEETKLPDISISQKISEREVIDSTIEILNLPNVAATTLDDITNANTISNTVSTPLYHSTSNLNPKDFASFQIYTSASDGFYEFPDSPIPTKDSGDCLTCSSSGSEAGSGDRKGLDFGVLDRRTVEDLQNMNDVRARQRGLEELLRVVQDAAALDALRERLPSLLYVLFSAEQQPILQPVAEQALSTLFASMDQQALISRLHQIALNLSKMGSPLGVRLALLLMRRIPPGLLVDQLLADPILGAKSSKVREGALQILMTVSRIFPSNELNIPKSIKASVGMLRDKKKKVRQAALETLAALAQQSSPGTVLDVVDDVMAEWPEKDQILRVIRTRLSRKKLPAVNMNGNIRYSTPTGESEIEWLSHGSGSLSPRNEETNNNQTQNSNIKESKEDAQLRRRRFKSATADYATSSVESNARYQTYSIEDDTFPKRFVQHDDYYEKRRMRGYSADINENVVKVVEIQKSKVVEWKGEQDVSMATLEEKVSSKTLTSSSSNRENSARTVIENGESSNERNERLMKDYQDRYVQTREAEVFRVPSVPVVATSSGSRWRQEAENRNSAALRAVSGKKVNYWKSNNRRKMLHGEEGEEENIPAWPKDPREEPAGRAPTTQIWAINPSAFAASEKLSTSNGTLRQIYVVKTNEQKSTATNTPPQNYREGATNTSPAFGRQSSRGRSFSPPSGRRTAKQRQHLDQDDGYLEYDEQEKRRFIRAPYEREEQRLRHERRVRKSFSTENLPAPERLRKEDESSGSSSGSSTRQTGNWHRDLRSGIPVPIFSDSKLRLRNRTSGYKSKGPITIPYYPPVKSPSPQTTPEKFTLEPHIIRQPFSSGSESSGYFTPPPEPQEQTPDATPKSEHRSPERFIQIDTPKHSEHSIVIDSEADTLEDEDEEITIEAVIDDEVEEVDAPEEKKFERNSTSGSLDEFTLRNGEFVEELPDAKSLDGTDFTHNITFSEKRALSKSEVDIKISTHILRKNVNSAPALNEIIADFQTFEEVVPPKTSLPGSVEDSLDDTEVPEELFIASPKKPVKKSTPKFSAKRKSFRVTATTIPVYADNLRPYTKPKEALHEISDQLESSEWEVTMKGLQGMVRLIRHHKEVVESNMHAICVLLGKHIRNLRSQVARAACLAASELFTISKRPLEMELDELAAPLLHRTADTNKFLRADANAALDEMVANLSVPKVVAVITYRGCAHQNAVVRCAAARLLSNIVQKLGAEKVFQLPRDTRDKIVAGGANMLTEGSLETRKHAKLLLGNLVNHVQFQRALAESVSASVLRHIDKSLKALMKS